MTIQKSYYCRERN